MFSERICFMRWESGHLRSTALFIAFTPAILFKPPMNLYFTTAASVFRKKILLLSWRYTYVGYVWFAPM